MSKIDRGIKKLPIPQRIERFRQITTACTGNALFTTLTTELTALSTRITQLETDYNAAKDLEELSKAATVTQNASADAVAVAAETLFLGLEKLTGGDAAKLNAAGVDVHQPGATPNVVALAIPNPLKVETGEASGTMHLSWAAVHGASSYLVQYSATPDAPGSWQTGGVATKTKHTVTGLTSGTKYGFRVCANGAAGQSAFTDVVQKYAP